jgi:hypothetical protein
MPAPAPQAVPGERHPVEPGMPDPFLDDSARSKIGIDWTAADPV